LGGVDGSNVVSVVQKRPLGSGVQILERWAKVTNDGKVAAGSNVHTPTVVLSGEGMTLVWQPLKSVGRSGVQNERLQAFSSVSPCVVQVVARKGEIV